MTVLYIREQGAQVVRKNEQIRVRLKDNVLTQTPVRKLDQIIVYGNVQVTTQAAALLVRHAVDVVFYSSTGRFRFRLLKDGSRYASLRRAQFRLVEDPQHSLTIAKAIVAGKLENQRRLLEIWARFDSRSHRNMYRKGQASIENMSRQGRHAPTVDILRGFEGKAANSYFALMRRLVPSRWGFQQRAYHPPPDPWNATLSFGYSLLLKDVLAAIELVGLDAYVGFFHALEANRPSLALDLMEEFRPLVDDAMLRLLLAGRLLLSRYRRRPGSTRPVEIGAELLPVVIEGYEAALSKHLKSLQSGTLRGRAVIEAQVRQIAVLIVEQRHLYRPVVIDFQPLPPARKQVQS